MSCTVSPLPTILFHVILIGFSVLHYRLPCYRFRLSFNEAQLITVTASQMSFAPNNLLVLSKLFRLPTGLLLVTPIGFEFEYLLLLLTPDL